MFVLLTTRVVKLNTGATEKFSPRSGNMMRTYVSGPFNKLLRAQRAASAALSTHTCLSAQVVGADLVHAEIAKGYSVIGNDRMEVMREAARLLDAVAQEAAV